MSIFTKFLSLVSLTVLMGSVSLAQDLSLKGRSAIELNIGLWGGPSASTTTASSGVRSEAGTNGLVGGLTYAYWLREHLSLTVTASLLSAQASSTVSVSSVTQQASTVVPLLLGLRYYIPEPGAGENVRPFLSAAVGMYLASEAASTLLSQKARTENVIGGRLGAGIDFLLGSDFKLGANVGYHLMGNYGTPIGARKNYNGGELSLGIGYVF